MSEGNLKVAIVGGGREGFEALSVLAAHKENDVVLLVEPDKNALVFRLRTYGMDFSDHLKITLSHRISDLSSFKAIDLIVDATGNPNLHRELCSLNLAGVQVMNSSAARLLWELKEIESLPVRQSLAVQKIKGAFEEIDLANDEVEFYAILLDVLLHCIGGSSARLYLCKGEERKIELEYKRGLRLDGTPGSIHNPMEMRIACSVLERREPLVLKRGVEVPGSSILLGEPVIAFPITSEGEIIGVIEAEGRQDEGGFSDEDLLFAAQLSSVSERFFRKLLALQEVKELSLHESLRRILDENLSLEIPITDRLAKCLEIVARSLNARWYSLYIKDPNTKDLVLQVSNEIGQNMLGQIRIKEDMGIIGETSKSGHTLCLKESASINTNNNSRGSRGMREIICLPMVSQAGTVGVLSFVMPDLKGKTEKIVGLLEDVSRALAGSIASDTERHRMSQKVLKLSVVNEEGLELLSTIDRDKVLRLATASAAMILDAEAVILRLLEKKEDKFLVGSTYGLHNDEIDKKLVDLDARVAEMVRERKDAVSISDLKEMEGISEPFPYNSVLSLPLLWEEKIIGSLAMYNKLVYNSFSCTFFNEDDKEILEKYVQYVARALLNAQQYKDREALVTIDELTGLRNERYLKIRLPEEIRRADRYQRAISLVYMDVDKFGDIVKGMQESIRKEVIKKLAGIIRENFRNVDIIVRLEESKFAVLLPDTGERVKEAIQRMSGNLRSVKIKNVSTGNITPLQLMIGYSTYPYDSNDINTLIENASKMVPVG